MPQDPKGDKNRLQFKQLIAANPNYFAEQVKDAKKKGTLDAPGPPTGNMTYEQLTCVGFQPDLNLLEATVQIKLSSGYLTELCDAGSTEYVSFFIDYGTGAGWEDLGYAAFNIHDLPDFKDCAKNPDKPISFVVTHPLDPKRDYCKRPVLPVVRAILSWEAVPTGPNYPVVWGNGLDRHIQIKRRDWKIIDIMTELSAVSTVKLKLPPQLEAVKMFPIPIPDPPDPELGDLVQLYGAKQGTTKPGGAPKTSVESHRFGMSDIQSALAPGAFTQQSIVSKIDKWKGLGLDWPAAIAALDKTSGNTNYEQLDCLGLDYNLERLVATFRIKLNGGYSGGPCDNGSKEHVAFWADWDNTCKWTYLDTVSVVVHDFDPIPGDGLNYAAVLRVNLNKYRRSCKEPKVGRVRAVLSWNQLPSTTDPDALPPWGNRVDAHVQIKPGIPIDGPIITAIGGIGVDGIDIALGGMTKTGARFVINGSFADPWDSTRSCPFGGQIVVQGVTPPGMLGFRYRVLARQVGIVMVPLRIANDIWIVNRFGVGAWHSADADGAFPYLSNDDNFADTLAFWTPGGDELWEIRVQVIDGGGAEIAGTGWHKVQVDNTKPVAELTIDGGACDKYTPGTVINGHFVARDLHFGAFGLEILPASLWPPNPNSALPSTAWPATSQTPVSPGAVWTVHTAGMAPCGYVVRIVVYDRTIVGSYPGSHNAWWDDKGFCLLEK